MSEGAARPRRGRSSVALGVGAIALLAVIWLTGAGRGSDELPAATGSPGATIPTSGITAPSLHGRLVYAAAVQDGTTNLRRRLFVFDLDDRSLEPGPRIPTATLLARVDADTVAVIADVPRGRQEISVYATLDADAVGTAIASGDVVTVAPDGLIALVVRARGHTRSCGGPGFEASTIFLRPGVEIDDLERAFDGCGTVVSGVMSSLETALTVVDARGHASLVRAVGPAHAGSAFETVLDGVGALSLGPTGTYLLADLPATVDPNLPVTGPLLVWPGGGAPRPAVEGLDGTRVLGWMPGGGIAVVNGTLDGQRAMWLVNPSAGTAVPVLPSNRFDLGTAFSGATFDRTGDVFGASAGVIVVATSNGTFPIPLPAGAPVPAGPIVWLP